MNKTYIIYFLNKTSKYITTTYDLVGNEHFLLQKIGINYDDVDYLVKINPITDPIELNFKKYMPDGSSVWNRTTLVDFKINQFLKKRKELLTQLDLDFLISLEQPNNPKTELIKRNKNFLRDLSIRDEVDGIHEGEKLYKLNAFFNLIKIEIVDPGFGCTETFPLVIIDPPNETEYNYGLPSLASCVRGVNGEIISLEVTKIGCGYRKIPNIQITGFNDVNSKQPILKPIIVNMI